jgi:hypothetical protein
VLVLRHGDAAAECEATEARSSRTFAATADGQEAGGWLPLDDT